MLTNINIIRFVGALVILPLKSLSILQQTHYYANRNTIYYENSGKENDLFYHRTNTTNWGKYKGRSELIEKYRKLQSYPINLHFIELQTECRVDHAGKTVRCTDIPTITDAQDCNKQMSYSYNVTNTGNTSQTINVVQRTRFGETIVLTSSNPNLNPGESSLLPESVFEFDFCNEKQKEISTVVTIQTKKTNSGQIYENANLHKAQVAFQCGVGLIIKNCLYDSVGDESFSTSCDSMQVSRDSSNCDKVIKYLYNIKNVGPVTQIIYSLKSQLGSDILDSVPSSRRVLEPGDSIDTEEIVHLNMCSRVNTTVLNQVTVSADTFPIDLGSSCNSIKTHTFRGKSPTSTTKAPKTTTKSPKSSTKVPKTTEAPTSTTKAPKASTKSPTSSTKAPKATTKSPTSTTKAPKTTTKSPISTTKAPKTTTKSPSSTTATSKAPKATTKSPTSTTKAPKATTKSPTSSTKAPKATTNPPTSSTKAPKATTNPPTSYTKAPKATTESPTSSTKVPKTATESPTSSTKAPKTATESPSSTTATTKAPKTTTESPTSSTKVPKTATESPTSSTKAPKTTTESPTSSTKAPKTTTESPTSTILNTKIP